MAIILGIESTAHTFGCGVVKNGEILSNERDLYTTEHGGLIPIELREHHQSVSEEIYQRALKEANISESVIEGIAFSNAPGLAPSLLVGMNFAKTLAKRLDVPLIPINHCIAHLEIGTSIGSTDPVMLYASGANTQIIAYEAGKYRVFGETLDLGVGNFIDTFARFLDLGFPGGPKIEKLAKKSKNFVELPYVVKGMDVSFSGIQTKLKQLHKKGIPIEDLSFSMQETVFAMLVEAAERALAHTEKKELLLAGGVACNSRLQEMCKLMCEARGVSFYCPPKTLLVDNGAMIAHLGHKLYLNGEIVYPKDFDTIDILPRERTDDVNVKWK